MRWHELIEGDGPPEGSHTLTIEKHGTNDFRVVGAIATAAGIRVPFRNVPFSSDGEALKAVLNWTSGLGVEELYVARSDA